MTLGRRSLFVSLLPWAVGVAALLAGCFTGSGETEEALFRAGFTQIKAGGLAPLACSESDKTGRHFTAVNQGGASVAGVVCCGVFKGCTVRF